jgi:2-dehydropantoate 2-reductase
MDALLVGAGAVGQVLGLHLQRGGARVHFLVRPAYAEATRRGFVLQPLHGARAPATLTPDGVLTTVDEVAARRWDVVLLCVSSTALRAGSWLADVARAAGAATVVAIQPGLDDPALVGAQVPRERLVWSMFGLVSYVEAEATRWYLPPLARLPFDGPRARPIAETLTRGGLPSVVRAGVADALAFAGAALDLHIVALECAGWSLASLRRDRALVGELHAALDEALAVAAHHRGRAAPWLLRRLLRPWVTRLLLRLVPRLAPFDAERYLRGHFTKVGDQTAAQLDAYVALAAKDTPALRRLRERLAHHRRQGGPDEHPVRDVRPQAG